MHSSLGLVIIVFSGVLIASFAAPMKLSRTWSWENTWLIYATLALLVVPLALVLWTIPHPSLSMRRYPSERCSLPFCSGSGGESLR
jgi:hypothetical protein